MKKILRRKAVAFDIESTGLDTKEDRIVQISMTRVDEYLNVEETLTLMMNPMRPISPEASAVNGLLDEMVNDLPSFKEFAIRINNFFDGYDIIVYNLAFDVPMLANHFRPFNIKFPENGVSIIDVQALYRHFNPRRLSDAHLKYVGVELEGAHDANNDVIGTINVLKGIKQVHEEDLPDFATMEKISIGNMVDFDRKFIRRDDGEVIFNFGPHRGEPVMDHVDFLGWMLTKDFSRDTMDHARELRDKSRLAQR